MMKEVDSLVWDAPIIAVSKRMDRLKQVVVNYIHGRSWRLLRSTYVIADQSSACFYDEDED